MTDNISMLNLKRSAFILLIHLLLIPSAFGEGDISESGVRAIGGPEESAETSQNSILNRMLEHERVQPAKTACDGKKDDGATTYGNEAYQSYGECIWGHLSAEDQSLLSEAIKSEQAKERDEAIRASGGTPNDYDSVDLGVNDMKLTPEMEKMQDFMSEKISKSLYGEGDKEKVAGHGNFYKLYKSSLGKNLIQSITTYCMGTNFDVANSGKRFLYEEDNLENNYKSWENALKTSTGDNNESVQAVGLWNLCLAHIQFICLDARPPKLKRGGGIEKPDFVRSSSNEISYITQADIDRDPNDDITQDKLGQTKDNNVTGDTYCLKDNADQITDSSQKHVSSCQSKYMGAQPQACVVYRAMKDTKYAMQTIDKITDRFNEIAAGGASGTLQSDAEIYRSEGEDSINAMTTFNSNELVEESGLAEDYNKTKEEFYSKCFNEQSNTIINSDECSKYLDTNRNEKENEIAEFLIRKRAMEKKLESDFEDPEKLKSAIKELGYTDDKVEELMGIDNGNFIKDQIRKRMAAETDALHKALVSKMNATTSVEDGAITADNDQSTLEKIGKTLSSKTDRMKQLIRFNNIVSGFLEVENSESGERSKNLLGLQEELGIIDGSGDAELERISRTVSDTGVREGGSSDSDNATLGADTIDSELIYIQGGGNGGN